MIGVSKLMGKIIDSIENPENYSEAIKKRMKEDALERLPPAYIVIIDSFRSMHNVVNGKTNSSISEEDKKDLIQNMVNTKKVFPH